jgi:hypothetical protein
MLKEINRENLKMKHLICVRTDAPLDAEDFLFEIIQAMEEKNWPLDGKGRTIPQLRWAGLNSPIEGMDIESSMKKAEELGWISSANARGTTYYSIINHPW